MKSSGILALAVRGTLLLAVVQVGAGDGDDILGLWRTEEDKSTVEIYKCGDRYCGRIIDLKYKVYPDDDPLGMAGQERVDRNNAEESRRDVPLMGLQLMEGFEFKGDMWRGGTIYDPENGKTYKCKIRITEDGSLKLRGYVGAPALGRTSIWRR